MQLDAVVAFIARSTEDMSVSVYSVISWVCVCVFRDAIHAFRARTKFANGANFRNADERGLPLCVSFG